MSAGPLGYVVVERNDRPGGEGWAQVAYAAPLVYGTLAEASRERDRLEAHARIDADLADPPGYEVAQVVAL